MIVLYHKKGRILKEVVDAVGKPINTATKSPLEAMFQLANIYPNEYVCWQSSDLKGKINNTVWTEALHYDGIMVSDLSRHNPIPNDLHYAEESPFLKVQLDTTYPTWQMSSDVGAVHAQVLLQVSGQIKPSTDLDIALNLIAKSCQSQGLFCYHTPLIERKDVHVVSRDTQVGKIDAYLFTAKTKKKKWLFFLFLCHVIYDKRFPVVSFLKALFTYSKRINFDCNRIVVNSTKTLNSSSSIDVIIPTMGREKYLYDVLKDFSKQTVLPEKIIIVEQNADPKSITALSYIKEESWPFKIIHQFIHQTGACNARNEALAETTADWVFFADDDIRFQNDLLEKATIALQDLQAKCLAISCLQKNEKKTFNTLIQWSGFPSGASMVEGTLSRKLKFNTAYEHGYGEDADYGMQLRNAGADVLYFPYIELLHLKAPVGGFRQKIIQPWEAEEVQPKPSPTVMLYRLKHSTNKQLKGYKLRLFLRIGYQKKLVLLGGFIKQYKKAWNSSIRWAKTLDNR